MRWMNGMTMKGRLGVAAALLSALGCAISEPAELDPQKSEAEFRARTLEDAGLVRFIEANRAKTSTPSRPEGWDLGTLTLVAFYFHPELDLARARLTQAQAGRVTAGMWPNPVVGVELSKVANVEPGFKPWIYGANLSIPIDTLWKRGYKIEEAERTSEAATLALAETGWRVRSRVRAALADHLLWLRELDLRRDEAAARTQVVGALERKLALGDIFRLDVDVAQGDLHATRLQIHTAEGKVAESRAELAASVGLPGSSLRGIRLEWPDLVSPPPLASLGGETALEPALQGRLDLRGLLAEYGAAVAALRHEMAARYPDVSLGPGYTYDQGQKKFNLGLQITLPLLNQNDGPVAEAEARRKEVAARFAVAQAAAIAELETALERYRAALAELEEAGKSLDLLRARERSGRRAIELGDLEPTALLGTRLELVKAEQSRVESLRHAEDALGSLEDAVQRPLGSRAGSPGPLDRSPRERD
jgi:cobalt-zinc-cadmium efflux system outer membrane protein